MTIGIIIQARTGSSRLPEKVLMSLSGIPLIVHVYNRCLSTGIKAVIATSDEKSDNKLFNFLKSVNIPCFRGSLNNVLERYIKCAEEYGFEKVIRVTGDNPLIDFERISLFKELDDNIDYACVSGGPLGGGSEYVKLSCLKDISKGELSSDDIEHVTLNIVKNKQKYNFKIINGYDKLKKLRVTVDEKKDFELMNKIYGNLYSDRPITYDELYEFYEKNKEIFKINEDVKQKKF